MASPQNDFIVAPETNQAPLPIEPLALVTQHYTAENLSLPLQEQNHHLLSKTLTILLRLSSLYGGKPQS